MTGAMTRTGAAVLAMLALAACSGRERDLAVDGAWVRLAANPDAPAAAYFAVHGWRKAETLTSVTSDEALKAEMHDTMTMKAPMPGMGAMTTMTPLARVAVPANGDVAFRPGGRHVMLFDVNKGVRPGGVMVLVFDFASGARLVEKARVIAAGDPAPR